MKYQLKQIHCRPWTLSGLSLKLIESHYENNYGGALRRLNAITEQLEALDYAKAPANVINGLKREELVALNSTLLHELYFASMGGEGKATKTMTDALARDFGSVQRWRTEFSGMGYALGGGSGWVLLTWMPRDGRLINQYASDHSQGIAGGVPILALDMYEHAYQLDFGAQAGAWVDAFMNNLSWEAVYQRYQLAVYGASEPFGAEQGELSGAELLDVRRAGVFEAASQMLPTAHWRDPSLVGDWGRSLDPAREVVVYCVYGHEVGRSTALRLRAQGLKARFLRGGFDGWQSAGLPLVNKGEGK